MAVDSKSVRTVMNVASVLCGMVGTLFSMHRVDVYVNKLPLKDN